ncbi:Zinc finger, FYVE/PHD-type [Parasponia andersonii]|uniref:Zinc finger, FYVE/PHD-type n=1 Tax=Parasponia andersonii TaxID=3476 RepID=A0A2P5C8X3_PARAD|nr:Zinc finger, FYVE/PHD-type [Parasponia andersonii]
MSQLDLTSCKKRKKGERVFRFKSFGEHGYPVEFVSAFRENVKALLEFGHLESNLGTEMPCWSFQLEVNHQPLVHVLLFVIEEPIGATVNYPCRQCQYVGWGQHMICNKKYHFLLPSKDSLLAACLNCKGNGSDQVVGDSGNCSKSNIFVESQGHVMHGVFHSNGFGHLLCVNGLETGSDLAGCHVLEFWDRLCTGLRVRKVSLCDISQKKGMDLRLVHGVAYGESWFGRWGYKFGRGTYSVTQNMYQRALEALRGMPLNFLIHYLCPSNRDLPLIFSKYQTLSDQSLTTLGDLFHFMLELKSHLPNDTSNMESYNPGILVETSCRWSPKRVEMATRVIVEALKRAQFRWVSRQQVRDAARNYIGDTGLLDFVLKSLGNQIVGNYLVRRSLNPVTKVLEYCLEDISNVFHNHRHEGNNFIVNGSKIKYSRYKITRFQLIKDIFFLYKCILKDHNLISSNGGNILSAIPVAVRIVLDSKYLIKEYHGDFPAKLELGLEGNLNLYCTLVLKNSQRNDHYDEGNWVNSVNKPMLLPPYEFMTVKNNATVDEMKLEVERNFKEIYWGLRDLVVDSIRNFISKGTNLALGVVSEIGQKLVFEGSIRNKDHNYNNDNNDITNHTCLYGSYGSSNSNDINVNKESVMDCPCGAKDDDGERRVACDICETWQHTRCVGIQNSEDVPHVFICGRCEQEIILLPNSLP